MPSASLFQSQSEESLRLLDDPQEWSAFSRSCAPDASIWESYVVIEGMHCAACAFTVEEAMAKVPGVLDVRVSAGSHRARVLWSASRALPSRWMRAVQSVGYRVVPANDVFASERRRKETRQALWRWLVAGLCMMQVMMYAYPAYVARPGDLSAEMEGLLRWASWVLTLPVVLFSCGPFFRNALRDVLQRRISMDLPVALGMLITFVVSTAGTFEPQGIFGREVFFDSLTMFVFFLLTGRWLELRLRDRTAGALEALMNRFPDSAQRLQSDGSFERVAARRVVVGDIVRVHAGETFVADGVVVQGSTWVDEALLTGESTPLVRDLGAAVIAGSHNVGSTVQVRVVRTGGATRFAQVLALMQSAATTKPHLTELVDRLARPFLWGVLLASGAACAWWWSRDPSHAVMVAVAVLIVTCPCALSLATPAAMLASAGTLARSGVLVRRLQALESLSKVDTVVFDKTGTLTRDALVLGKVDVRVGMSRAQALAMAAAMAKHSLHPVSRALVLAASSALPGERGEIASSAETAQWTCGDVTEVAGQGLSAWSHASATGVESDKTFLRLGSAQFCGVSLPPTLQNARVFLSDSSGWVASFEMQEELRPQAAEMVSALIHAGVQVHMLSGDNALSVARVAAQLGIANAQGAASPQDKLEYVRMLQEQGRMVAMVGDGLNDGPVLAACGVAFTLGNAVPLTQAKADFVVQGDQPMAVVRTWSLARRTQQIVRQNLCWALIYNAACIPLAVLGMLPAWLAGLGMATSSLVVVLNALRLSTNLLTKKN